MNTIRELKAKEKYNNMLKRKNKEIKRLNNIIDELEKHLEHEIKEYKENGYDILEIRKANLWLTGCYDEDKNILNKLQKSKGVDKE